MKKLIFSVSILFFGSLTMAQKTKLITIKGNVSGDTKGYNTVYYFTGSNLSDSVLIENGKFTIEIPFTKVHTVNLSTKYSQAVTKNYQTLSLFIDGSDDVQIEMNIHKGFSEAILTGAKSAIDYSDFRKKQILIFQKVDEVVTSIYGKSFVPPSDSLYSKINFSRDSGIFHG